MSINLDSDYRSPEEKEAALKFNAEQFDLQARERNKHRSLSQKMSGRGKVSGIDIAHEEAEHLNGVADKRVSSGLSTSILSREALPNNKLPHPPDEPTLHYLPLERKNEPIQNQPEHNQSEVIQKIELGDGNIFETTINNNIAIPVLKNSAGEIIFDFTRELPEKWIFPSGASTKLDSRPLYTDHFEKQIHMENNKFQSKKDLLCLLHEIGHTWVRDPKLTKRVFPSFKEMMKASAKEERNAWTWALIRARQLREGEITDLFSEFEDYNEFINWLHGEEALGSYQRSLWDDPKLKGIFSRKYKRDQN